MSEASRDLAAQTLQKEVAPNYFGYYKREILELFSQDEDNFSSFFSQVEEIPGQSFNGKENSSLTSSRTLFNNAIGAKLSEFKKERLKASLRQSVTTLTQEVDELLDPVVAMCRIQSRLRDKKRQSNYSSTSDGNPKQSPCKRQKITSSPSTSSTSTDDGSLSCSSTGEDSGSEEMDGKLVVAGLSEESQFSRLSERYNDCQTTKAPQRGDGPVGPKVNDDLPLLLETGGLEVEETVKKYSDELAAKLGNMEQQLEELLDILMSKCRPMTLIEKQQLKKLIQKLPPKNLDRVVEIVRHSEHPETNPCDEIHIDLEKEDDVTLWRLYYYVEAVENAKKLSSQSN